MFSWSNGMTFEVSRLAMDLAATNAQFRARIEADKLAAIQAQRAHLGDLSMLPEMPAKEFGDRLCALFEYMLEYGYLTASEANAIANDLSRIAWAQMPAGGQ